MSTFLFYRILASAKHELPEPIQKTIIQWCSKANTRESSSILADLAGREDLTNDSVKQLAKNKSAKVVATMLVNPSIDKEITTSIIVKEKRISVLTALASITEDSEVMRELIEKNNYKILESLLSNPNASVDVKALTLAKLVNLSKSLYGTHAHLRSFLSDNPESITTIAQNVNGNNLSFILDNDLRYLDAKTTQHMVDELITNGLRDIKNNQKRDPNYISADLYRGTRWSSNNDLSEVLVRLHTLTTKTNLTLDNLKKPGILWMEIQALVDDKLETYIESRTYSSRRESALAGATWLKAVNNDPEAVEEVKAFLDEKNRVLSNSLNSSDKNVLQGIVTMIYRNDPNAGLLTSNLLKNKNFTLECLPLTTSGKHHKSILVELLNKGGYDDELAKVHIENYIRNSGDLEILDYVSDQLTRIGILEKALADLPAWRIDSALGKNIYAEEILKALSIEKLYQVKEHGHNPSLDLYVLSQFEEFLGETPNKIKEFEGLSQDYQGSLLSLIEASQKI